MKIKSIAAVGAMGVGLGLASFIGGAGTASAGLAATDAAPPVDANRVACVSQRALGEFLRTDPPAVNLDVLVNGTADDDPLRQLVSASSHQPNTFTDSLAWRPMVSSTDPVARTLQAPESANGF